MAANDGPVPVRVLAHAARLMREARQLAQYGVTVGRPAFNSRGVPSNRYSPGIIVGFTGWVGGR